MSLWCGARVGSVACERECAWAGEHYPRHRRRSLFPSKLPVETGTSATFGSRGDAALCHVPCIIVSDVRGRCEEGKRGRRQLLPRERDARYFIDSRLKRVWPFRAMERPLFLLII